MKKLLLLLTTGVAILVTSGTAYGYWTDMLEVRCQVPLLYPVAISVAQKAEVPDVAWADTTDAPAAVQQTGSQSTIEEGRQTLPMDTVVPATPNNDGTGISDPANNSAGNVSTNEEVESTPSGDDSGTSASLGDDTGGTQEDGGTDSDRPADNNGSVNIVESASASDGADAVAAQ